MATFYTPIPTGARSAAATFNSVLQEIDNALLLLMTQRGKYLSLPPYNAVGDGTTDDSDALEDAIESGGYIIGEPGAEYVLSRDIEVPSNTMIDWNGATLIQKGVVNSNGFLHSTGTQSAKVSFTANQTIGSITVALPTGEGAAGGWARGDLIMIESNDIDIDISGTDCWCKETYKVMKVSGDNLIITGGLEHTYTTANSAKYSKITPAKNIVMRNLKATNGHIATYVGYSYRVDFGENILMENTHLFDCGGGINLNDVYGFLLHNTVIETVTDYATVPSTLVAYGYGILVGATTCFGLVDGYRGEDLRHCFTTIAEQRSGGTQLYGSPRHITVKNGYGVAGDNIDSTAIWDTHTAGRDIVFDTCLAMGGTASLTHGFQLRSPTKLINCVSLYCGGRGVSLNDGAEGSVIQGGEFAYNGLQAINSRPRVRVLDAVIHHNTGSGVGTSTDMEIKRCKIYDNGNYGIQAGAGTHAMIQNNYIPYSVAQATAVLNAPATTVIEDNDFGSGYTGGNALFGVDAAAIVRRNKGYVTENSGTDSIPSGSTTRVVAHGCNRQPTVDDISITFAEQATNDYGRFWVDTIGSLNFTVRVQSDPGASNLDFGWRVVQL